MVSDGYQNARDTAEALRTKREDTVAEFNDEPINLDDIPFN
jgi:hypothetical protein